MTRRELLSAFLGVLVGMAITVLVHFLLER